MKTPSHQDLLIPFLNTLRNGDLLSTTQIAAKLQNLSPTSTPSTSAPPEPHAHHPFKIALGWVGHNLAQSGLVTRPSRSTWQITAHGRALLPHLTPALRAPVPQPIPKNLQHLLPPPPPRQPPKKLLQQTTDRLNAKNRQQILDDLSRIGPLHFERLTLDLLVAMGYAGSRPSRAFLTRRSNDEGIDGILHEDPLGLRRIFIQTKRWTHTVGRPEVQAFVGALAGQHAREGIFVTSGRFSPQARLYADRIAVRLVLIDGPRLAALLTQYPTNFWIQNASPNPKKITQKLPFFSNLLPHNRLQKTFSN